jgi:hypothetical protein
VVVTLGDPDTDRTVRQVHFGSRLIRTGDGLKGSRRYRRCGWIQHDALRRTDRGRGNRVDRSLAAGLARSKPQRAAADQDYKTGWVGTHGDGFPED